MLDYTYIYIDLDLQGSVCGKHLGAKPGGGAWMDATQGLDMYL